MPDRHVYRGTYAKWKRETEVAEQVTDLREAMLIEALNRWHGHDQWALDDVKQQARQRLPHGVDGPVEIVFRGETILRFEPPEPTMLLVLMPGQAAYSLAYEFLGRCARETEVAN